ncbi:MAG: hypothetical protein LV481_04600 [Methylacidiphilales bacterium]|nr:hypothetical protein [Candidatus Methylacidiphilales bacterium]
MKVLCAVILVGLSCLTARAEDWTTTDGKTYKNIVVTSHDTSVVTISCTDGICTFPISHLSKDIQQRILNDNTTATDWTTTDGHTYRNVKVLKQDDATVTIIDEEGGAVILLSKLAPDLQKKFHYDPTKAQAELQKKEADQKAAAIAKAAEQKAAAVAQAAKQRDDYAALINARTLTIKEVETDQSSFVGRKFIIQGSISLSTNYNYGYMNLETTHYSFQIDQGGHTAYAYAPKILPSAVKIRNALLATDGPLDGCFEVEIDPARFDCNSGDLYLLFLDYFPPIPNQ